MQISHIYDIAMNTEIIIFQIYVPIGSMNILSNNLSEIGALISSYIYNFQWDENTKSCPYLNKEATVEVTVGMNN